MREVSQEHLEAVRSQARQFQKETRARGGLDGTREIEALESELDTPHGFDPSCRKAPAAEREETEAAVILTKDADLPRVSVLRARERPGVQACGEGLAETL